jgi:hypothetical protein
MNTSKATSMSVIAISHPLNAAAVESVGIARDEVSVDRDRDGSTSASSVVVAASPPANGRGMARLARSSTEWG